LTGVELIRSSSV